MVAERMEQIIMERSQIWPIWWVGVRLPTLILPAFAIELLLYEVLHYHGAVEFFIFLNDLLVVQASNLQTVDSKASHRSWYYEVQVPSRQSLENSSRLTASLFFYAVRSLLLVRAKLQD